MWDPALSHHDGETKPVLAGGSFPLLGILWKTKCFVPFIQSGPHTAVGRAGGGGFRLRFREKLGSKLWPVGSVLAVLTWTGEQVRTRNWLTDSRVRNPG